MKMNNQKIILLLPLHSLMLQKMLYHVLLIIQHYVSNVHEQGKHQNLSSTLPQVLIDQILQYH